MMLRTSPHGGATQHELGGLPPPPMAAMPPVDSRRFLPRGGDNLAPRQPPTLGANPRTGPGVAHPPTAVSSHPQIPLRDAGSSGSIGGIGGPIGHGGGSSGSRGNIGIGFASLYIGAADSCGLFPGSSDRNAPIHSMLCQLWLGEVSAPLVGQHRRRRMALAAARSALLASRQSIRKSLLFDREASLGEDDEEQGEERGANVRHPSSSHPSSSSSSLRSRPIRSHRDRRRRAAVLGRRMTTSSGGSGRGSGDDHAWMGPASVVQRLVRATLRDLVHRDPDEVMDIVDHIVDQLRSSSPGGLPWALRPHVSSHGGHQRGPPRRQSHLSLLLGGGGGGGFGGGTDGGGTSSSVGGGGMGGGGGGGQGGGSGHGVTGNGNGDEEKADAAATMRTDSGGGYDYSSDGLALLCDPMVTDQYLADSYGSVGMGMGMGMGIRAGGGWGGSGLGSFPPPSMASISSSASNAALAGGQEGSMSASSLASSMERFSWDTVFDTLHEVVALARKAKRGKLDEVNDRAHSEAENGATRTGTWADANEEGDNDGGRDGGDGDDGVEEDRVDLLCDVEEDALGAMVELSVASMSPSQWVKTITTLLQAFEPPSEADVAAAAMAEEEEAEEGNGNDNDYYRATSTPRNAVEGGSDDDDSGLTDRTLSRTLGHLDTYEAVVDIPIHGLEAGTSFAVLPLPDTLTTAAAAGTSTAGTATTGTAAENTTSESTGTSARKGRPGFSVRPPAHLGAALVSFRVSISIPAGHAVTAPPPSPSAHSLPSTEPPSDTIMLFEVGGTAPLDSYRVTAERAEKGHFDWDPEGKLQRGKSYEFRYCLGGDPTNLGCVSYPPTTVGAHFTTLATVGPLLFVCNRTGLHCLGTAVGGTKGGHLYRSVLFNRHAALAGASGGSWTGTKERLESLTMK